MNYGIQRPDGSDRVVLKQSRKLKFTLVAIALIFGLPLLAAGLLTFLDPQNHSTACLWTGSGLLLCCGAWGLAFRFRQPHSFIFDNASGCVTVMEKDGTSASLPYDEIQGFRTRLHREGRSVSHAAEMVKRDGAFWTFALFSGSDGAGNMFAELSDRVRLDAQPQARTAEPLPAGIERTDTPCATTLSWKPQIGPADHLFGLAAVSSVLLILCGSIAQAGRIAMVIAGVFAACLAGLMVFSYVYGAGKKFIVEITAEDFSFSKRGGITPGLGFTMPLADIDSVLFNFSPSRAETGIYLLKREEKKLFLDIGRGIMNLGDLGKAIALMARVKKIDATSLLTAEKTRLERLVQQVVAERSSRTGL